MMKHSSVLISIYALVSICCSCNREAFVQPIWKSDKTILIEDIGDSLVLKFGIDQWQVESVYCNGAILRGTIHDDLGDAMNASLRLVGNGTMQSSSENIFLKGTRDKDKELTLVIGPNFTENENDFFIELCNNFERDTIFFRQAAGGEYEFRDISWSRTADYSITEIDDSHVYYYCDNLRDTPYDFTYDVFEYARRQVFFEDQYGLSGQADISLTVTIPCGITSDGNIVESNETAPYRSQQQDLPAGLSEKRTITLQPGASVSIRPFWYMERMEVKYTLNFQNRASGKTFPVHGTMTSRTPTGQYFEH